MRRAFTLIELIFSMVIIAIAFTVLPKILQVSAKVSTQSIKGEALYSGVALMGYIIATAWDENNTEYDDILIVSSGDSEYDCNDTTHLRNGGFVGSRNCENNKSASSLGDDGGDLDDIDDFSSYEASNNNSRDYNLSVEVSYVDDVNLSEENFKTSINNSSTNTKYVVIDINSTNSKKTSGKNIAQLKLWMFNIGQIQINRIPWYE